MSVIESDIDGNLEEQIHFLSEMIENSSDAIVAKGEDQKIICWNSGAEKLFGYKKEEAIGKTPFELQFIKISSLEITKIENQINEVGEWKSERNFYHKNGNTYYGIVTGNFFFNKSGDKKIYYFIFKDITNQKRLEKSLKTVNDSLEQLVKFRTDELKETERYYRYLFEHNPMSMWVIAKDNFRFLDVNETAISQYGYSRNEFLSMTVLDIRPIEDRDSFINLYREEDSIHELKNRGSWRHVKKDGSVIHVEISAQSIIFNGIDAKLVLANDITEKFIAEEKVAASEKRFKSIIENSYDVYSLLDANFKLLYRSPSATRITGWTDDEIINSVGLKLIHPDDVDYLNKEINAKIFENPGVSYHINYRLLHKNGHYIHIEGSIINLLNDKSVNAIVINFHDITEKKRAEEKI